MMNSDAAGFAIGLAVNLILLGSSISVGVAFAFRLTPTAPPRARYVIAMAAFFAAAVLPAAATWRASREASSAVGTAVERAAEVSSAAPAPPYQGVPVGPPGTPAARGASPSTTDYPPARSRLDPFVSLDEPVRLMAQSVWAVAFLVVWVAVSLALLAREAAGHARLALLRRAWMPADGLLRRKLRWPDDIPLYVDGRAGPCAVGLLSRAAVIPERMCAELPPHAARRIALHELSHLRWRDPLFNTLLRVTRAVLWPSFPLWFLERLAREERESAADRAAVSGRRGRDGGDDDALDYAASLVVIARWSARGARRGGLGPIVTEVGGRTLLEERVRRLLRTRSPLTTARVSLASVVLLGGVTLTCLLPVASHPLHSEARSTAANLNGRGEDIRPGYEAQGLSGESTDGLGDEGPTGGIYATPFRDLAPGAPYSDEGTRLHSAQAPEAPALPSREDRDSPPGAATNGDTSLTANQDAQTRGQSVPHNSGADPAAEGMASGVHRAPSAAELATLGSADASHPYVRELAEVGYTNLPPKTLIRLREMGVSGTYVNEMKALGYDRLSPEMLVEFRRNGVTSAYIREMASLGYANLSENMIIGFRQKSIDRAFISEMRSLVRGDISDNGIVGLRQHGVTRQFIAELSALGHERLTATQLIAMKIHGVTIPFIREVSTAARGRLSADTLITMRQFEIPLEYVNGLAALGYENLSANQLSDMKQHGVTPAFIQRVRAQEGKDYSVHDLISMRKGGAR